MPSAIRMSRRMKTAGIIALLLATAGCIAAVAALAALQHVDPFYASAMELDPQQAAAAGRQLEERVAELAEPTPTSRWQAAFAEDEVNGWLATVLRDKLPELLPPTVAEPRVQLIDDRLMLGFRFVDEKFNTVVTVETEPRVMSEGVVSLRMRSARAGLLPLARSLVVEEVDLITKELDWPIEWTEIEGDLVLVVPMRNLFDTEAERRRLDELDLNGGEIVLGGAAENRAPPASQ